MDNSKADGLPCMAEILDADGNNNLQLRVPDKLLPSNAAWFGLVNLLRCGWAFCPSHFAPTVKVGAT